MAENDGPDVRCYESWLDAFEVSRQSIGARVNDLHRLRCNEVAHGPIFSGHGILSLTERDEIVDEMIEMICTLNLPKNCIFYAMYYLDRFLKEKPNEGEGKGKEKLKNQMKACVFLSGGKDGYDQTYDFHGSPAVALEVELMKNELLETVKVGGITTSFEALCSMIGEESESTHLPHSLLKLTLVDFAFHHFPPSLVASTVVYVASILPTVVGISRLPTTAKPMVVAHVLPTGYTAPEMKKCVNLLLDILLHPTKGKLVKERIK